jgi:hypothetical protein
MLMNAHDIGLRLDDLSDWELPPPSAGDMRPVRVFESADAALSFLRAQPEANRRQARSSSFKASDSHAGQSIDFR